MSKTTTKLAEKPKNVDIIQMTFDTDLDVVVGLGKNGMLYFYDKEESKWFKY